MITTSTLLVCLLAVVLSGGLGYFISFRFYQSNYAATNRSGYMGTPFGGFFAMMGGVLLSMLFFTQIGKFFLPAEALGPALIVSMAAGAISGVVGMVRGQNRRKSGGGGK